MSIVEKYITELKKAYYDNGGTSKLFIDFSPSEKGKKGKIVRFLHDPDEIEVIADSFDEYLEKLIEYKLDFINDVVI